MSNKYSRCNPRPYAQYTHRMTRGKLDCRTLYVGHNPNTDHHDQSVRSCIVGCEYPNHYVSCPNANMEINIRAKCTCCELKRDLKRNINNVYMQILLQDCCQSLQHNPSVIPACDLPSAPRNNRKVAPRNTLQQPHAIPAQQPHAIPSSRPTQDPPAAPRNTLQ